MVPTCGLFRELCAQVAAVHVEVTDEPMGAKRAAKGQQADGTHHEWNAYINVEHCLYDLVQGVGIFSWDGWDTPTSNEYGQLGLGRCLEEGWAGRVLEHESLGIAKTY